MLWAMGMMLLDEGRHHEGPPPYTFQGMGMNIYNLAHMGMGRAPPRDLAQSTSLAFPTFLPGRST